MESEGSHSTNPPTPEIINDEIIEQHEEHDDHRAMDGQSIVDEKNEKLDGPGDQVVEQQEQVAQEEDESLGENIEKIWKYFQFDWNSCPVRRINELKQGIKTGEIIRYFFHQSVDQMRDVNTNIPEYAMRIVANQIFVAFPDVFQDKNLRNEKLGRGCHTMTSKIINRNNNLNRVKEGNTLAQELGMKFKNLSRLKIVQSECKNWQPEIKLPYANL